MFTGSLDPVSNQEDWQFSYLVWDSEADEFIDISGCTITITVRDQETKASVLTGSTTGGQITLPEDGVFQVLFPESDMNGVCPKTYNVGIRIANDDRTVQFFIGTVPVLDGVDQQ